ncbi:O-antigen ligase family protein [Flagellimonas sediminis]|uniref:O-antigen ligase-related domain-containing protein n=1 Tax=Flagellimonas sediminis TaxID=2696468 RepID=A0A6I5KNR3_9FLAO|nr:O-antigen ligase family protein [Allomuricauda sediminis]NDV42147.1 hypothetical protein [Allomuricauda sediminis]
METKAGRTNFYMFGYVIIMSVIMPWSNALFNVLFLLGAACYLVSIIKKKPLNTNSPKWPMSVLVIMMVFMLLLILSVVVNNDWAGLNYATRMVEFILMPMMILHYTSSLGVNKLKTILEAFIASTTLLSIGSFALAAYKALWNSGNGSFFSKISYENLAMVIVHHQPIYFSIYVGFAIIALAYLFLFTQKRHKLNVIYAFGFLFLLAFIFLLGSRTGILATFVCLAILTFWKSKKAFFAFLGCGLLFFVINYSYNDSFKKRIDNVVQFNTDFDYHSDWAYEGLALRYMTWNCSLSCISENFWFGTGITDAQPCLDDCYKKNSYRSLLYFGEHQGTKFNSHSMFLDVFVKTGFLGFLVMVLLFSILLILAYKDHNILMILLIMFFLINGITESLLVREKGIVFFSFMLGLLFSLRRKEIPLA